MTNIESTFTKEKNYIETYGKSVVFHCNHYNRSLQQTIEDADYLDFDKILVKASAEIIFEQLTGYFSKNTGLNVKEKLAFASEIFRHSGFGLLDFSFINENGGKIISKISHYGTSLKLNFGHRTKSGEYFDKGFILGTLSAIKGTLSGKYFSDDLEIIQNKSISLNDDFSEYEISLENSTIKKQFENFVSIPSRKIETTVDEDMIVGAVSQLPLIGNEEGLIPAFGVYLTRMYADYYNKISFRFEEEMKKETGTYDLSKDLLIEAGHICAFYTFGGIMSSDEWYALIKPMFKTKEDWIHGMISVVNCLGWGVWRVEELIPNEKLVIRAYQDYESLGYLEWFGKADHPISYLLTGGCTGLMSLLYDGDITQKPELTKDYYYQLFNDNRAFKAEQTKCLAMGDDYSEVVVKRV